MKYTIRENEGFYSLWRLNKPAHRELPNNVELEFWLRLQEVEQAASRLVTAIESSDRELGCGDRTVDENEALKALKDVLEN